MPKVGLTVSYAHWPEDPKMAGRLEMYLEAARAGGAAIEPLFLDDWENRAATVAEQFDGIVLAGGYDLAPSWYGEEPMPEAGLELMPERRPHFEKTVVESFAAQGKPVLGICYGCQFLNVLRGGSLFQDIALQIPGASRHVAENEGVPHPVRVEKDSRLFAIVGQEEFEVQSYHHQAAARIAPGARVTAWAPDGVVEAIEWPGESFFLGVQWHPERSPGTEATQRLFAAFAGACRR